jgi:hypothetical protein
MTSLPTADEERGDTGSDGPDLAQQTEGEKYRKCMYLFTANGPKSGGRITSTLIIYKSK